MSFSSSFQDFLTSDLTIRAGSGRYPNSQQPGGYQFNVPASATASNSSNNGAGNTIHPPPVANADVGAQRTARSATNLSSESGNQGPTTATRASGTRFRRNNSTATAFNDDNDPNFNDGLETGYICESDLEYGIPARGNPSTAELSAKKSEKAAPKGKQKAPDPPRRKPHVKKSATQRASKRKASKQKAAVRKTSAVDNEISESETFGTEGDEIEASKVTGSAELLNLERFATRAYIESQSLLPLTRLFKLTRSTNDLSAPVSDLAETPSDTDEFNDLLESVPFLITYLRAEFLSNLLKDPKTIDQKIAVGFKRKQEAEDDEMEKSPTLSMARGKKDEFLSFNGLNTNLKPMNDISEIFDDLTLNALKNGLSNFLEAIGSAKLKVSTLCSGTESPLLAMQMIQDGLKNYQQYDLQIEHQFSCEIEPFKQAYIQRNFKPTILFRDANELHQEAAHTAFGAEEPVPNDADLMIAGSSCIDYSRLNSKPKEFGSAGESYETLCAVVNYAKAHRPNIVILENVFKFPWAKTEQLWQEAGYATKVAYLDSKDFYLPQTRQRGYMIGIRRAAIMERNADLDADAAAKAWFTTLGKLQRRASSPFTEFIFPDDDVQLKKYNRQAATVVMNGKNIPWEKCRIECISYRSCNQLGFKRPFTEWENNASCTVPDQCNKIWHSRQVERVLDTIDINFLRSVCFRYYDFLYKSRCVDLSQSCDRERENKTWGIVGCLTPTAIPYLTYRGGPMVGAEALSLQGIPREKLILNRESSKQLIDLSGNAMTSTTVGACILAALICCPELFSQPSARPVKPLKATAAAPESSTQLVYNPNWLLTKKDLTTDLRVTLTVPEMQALAIRSSRLCPCESPSRTLQQCTKCAHISCRDCGKKPQHKYDPLVSQALMTRTPCPDLEAVIRNALPPRLTIHGLLSAHKAMAPTPHSVLGAAYTDAIEATAGEAYQLASIKRGSDLTVNYVSRCSRLVLTCQPKWGSHLLRSENIDDLVSSVDVQWKIYARPGRDLPANSPIRKDLLYPIARLTCRESLFDGQWEVRTGADHRFHLEVIGKGQKVESWEKKQGLEHPTFRNRFVWSVLELRAPSGSNRQSAMHIPEGILGSYELLPDCGTACGSLHVKKEPLAMSIDKQPLFLFLDPEPLGSASFDSFVFANSHHKLGLKNTREVLAKVDAGWRPPGADEISSRIACTVQSTWASVDDMQLEEYASHDLQNVYLASAKAPIVLDSTGCKISSLPVIWCEFSMKAKIAQALGLKTQRSFHPVKDPFSLEPLDWLIKSAARGLPLNKWQELPIPERASERCDLCAPSPPGIVWERRERKVGQKVTYQIRPRENVREACDYERNVKAAPEAVTAVLSYNDHSELATLKIDFNILTLLHKAIAALSHSHTSFSGPSTIHWRAVVDHAHDRYVPFPQVRLQHCQNEAAARQPPSFGKLTPADEVNPPKNHPQYRPLLNIFQLRSLTWMIRRENDSNESWEEQEIVEAFVKPMSVRLEAKVTARRNIKGGVLADDVGYGKTALVIALVDYHQSKMAPPSPPKFAKGVDDTIKLKATLILVPSSLMEQWSAEIVKFLGNSLVVLALSKGNFAKNSSISKFQEADIILASWDLFNDDYFVQLAQMSRAPNTPLSSGRGFEEWFQMAQKDLKTLIKASDGLQPHLFSSAWHSLEANKYEKFSELSKRNKKGSQTSTRPAEAPPAKKAKSKVPEAEEIEIAIPAKPIVLLHAFEFERIVVDEFTYLQPKQRPAILALQSFRRWILSGTPPHNTFDGVSSMASFLSTSIGIPVDAAVRYQKVNDSKIKEIAGGEELRSYEAYHTAHWYGQRYRLAEQFLGVFARKNTTFVEGVEKHDHYHKVGLTALERALYFEVFLVMMNQGIKKAKQLTAKSTVKSTSGFVPVRTAGILEHIAASALPEDALVTACSTMPEFAAGGLADPSCHAMIKEKTDLIVLKMQDIISELRGAFWIISHYQDKVEAIPDIYHYLRSIQENRFGDMSVRAVMNSIIAYAESTKRWTVAKATDGKKPRGNSAENLRQHAMRNDMANEPRQLSKPSRALDLKIRADSLTTWTIALVDLVREQRFFRGIRGCLLQTVISCSFCGRQSNDYSTMVVMGRCGHAGCRSCFEDASRPGALLDQCLDRHCASKTSRASVVDASDLTAANSSALTRDHGTKMVEIMQLLSRLPKGEKVLIFVQFKRVVTALIKTLTKYGIQFADGTQGADPLRPSRNVNNFQSRESTCDVCILQLDTVDAAGWNMQMANHVVFVSSLVARTQHEYRSSMTQAIGRVVRMGQTKNVHIYHFLVEKTIEVGILEERTGKLLVEREGECLLLREGDTAPSERHHFGGLPLLGSGGGEEEDEEEEEDEDEA